MALTGYTDLLARLQDEVHHHQTQANWYSAGTAQLPTGGRWSDGWSIRGSAPGAAAVPLKTDLRAINQRDGGAGVLGCIGATIASASPGTYLLYDRLSHQSGLSTTTLTSQTTNLPTAALTRYTDGVGVMALMSIYTLIGTTVTSGRIFYTNQDGTAGRTGVNTVNGGAGDRETYRGIIMSLQAGDSGVRSIQSYTQTGSTGTAGNVGLSLIKPLAMFINNMDMQYTFNPISGGMAGGMPEILDGAVLSFLYMPTNTWATAWSQTMMTLNLTEW